MEGSRIHTGSGGGGGLKYGYGVQFFADDWPGLQKQKMLDKLSGENTMSRVLIGGTNKKYFAR
jgi:hypothetical protein